MTVVDEPPQPFRVLVVDDTEDLRFLTRFTLEQTGEFTVVGEAANGGAAILEAARVQPDVILLDVSMPGMDGMEALPHLRVAAPGAEVIMLSGFEERRLGASAIERGARCYLEKGLSPGALVDAVREALAGHAATPSDAPVPAGPNPVRLSASDIATVVAHDLRGPLNAIVAFGQALQQSWDSLDDARRRHMVDRMMRQAALLHAVAGNLVTSRSEEIDALDVDLEPIALNTYLAATIEALVALAPDHPIDLDVAAGLPPVSADASRLTEILVNLVGNASRFSPPDGRITVTAARAGDHVVLSVADDGPGIPPGARTRVFEKHVRIGANRGGLGLGLFVCAALADAMGGAIWVADERQGTRVCVRLRAVGF